MKALNFEGQVIINDNMIRGAINRFYSFNLIQHSLVAISNYDIDSAKENVCRAYELLFDALQTTFIVVKGSIS